MTTSRAHAQPPVSTLDRRTARTVAVAIALSSLVALLAALCASRLAERSTTTPGPGSSADAPATGSELPASAAAVVSATIGDADPAYRVRSTGGALQALSAPQRLRARFERSQVTLGTGSMTVGLAARAAGYAGAQRQLGAVRPSAAGNRVSYARAGLDEWYANGPIGLEQGFTVRRAPPAGSSASFEVSLSLLGGARPAIASGDGEIVLARAGRTSMRYGELSARDSAGRTLPSSLSLRGGQIELRVDTSGARFPVTIDPLIEQASSPLASGEEGKGRFGFSVALSGDGDTALVGAPRDGGFAGAAFVFTREGSTWTQQGPKLTSGEAGQPEEPCVGEAECRFGRSVALSADGNTALIGAPRSTGGSGAAWVFTRSGSTWTQFGEKLLSGKEPGGRGGFGRTVALSADGDTALVGAPHEGRDAGAAWAFTRTAAGFVADGGALTAPDQLGTGYFGASVALSANGGTALIGAPGEEGDPGAAWAFAHSAGGWEVQGQLTGGSEAVGVAHFGSSVALSGDGATALIGARTDDEGVGAAWVFTRDGASWLQQGSKLTGQGELEAGQFGYSVALSASGDSALIGGPGDNASQGAAWLFARTGTSWTQQGEKIAGSIEEGNSAFGIGVALSGEGDTALVGGPHAARSLGGVLTLLGAATPPAPTVTAIEPSSGPSGGGTHVTITGSGFLDGATVQIGGEATPVDVLSDTEITAVTPATPPGTVEVVVHDGNGSSSGGPSYSYLESASPSVSLASATNGLRSGGSTSSGSTSGTGSSGLLAASAAALPAPKLAVSSNIARLSGVVRVKLPGSAVFTLLSSAEQIPFGSIVDARDGKVAVTTASAHGGTQTMIFYQGEFQMTQRRDGLVVSTLLGGTYAGCPTDRPHGKKASVSRAKHVVRKLWAEGHGSYSTKGSYATGAVLGTRWLTEDLCEGTLIRVVTDRVAVTNLITGRHLVVKAGHSYLARAPH
jgi:hypothetical protein